ncbi:MAG: zinc-ribbon domain-containing protein, partial [Thermodesulfobacteriota bacterium]
MKLDCPKCGAVVSVPEDKVPAKGAWGRCPKCREKIFIQKPGPPAETAAPPPAPRRAQEPARRTAPGKPSPPTPGLGPMKDRPK